MAADTPTVAAPMGAEATSTAAASTPANPTAAASATLVATAAAANEARSLVCSDLRPRCQIVDRDCSLPPANTAIQDRHATSEAARITATVRVQVPQPIPRHGPAPAQTGAIRVDPQADSDPIVHRAPSEILPLDPRAKDGAPVGEPCRGESSRQTGIDRRTESPRQAGPLRREPPSPAGVI